MLRIYLERKDYASETVLHLIDERENGERWHAQPVDLVFKRLDDGSYCEPFLKTGGAVGQQFLNGLAVALADAGYKVDTSSERGELAATKTHLAHANTILDRVLTIVEKGNV